MLQLLFYARERTEARDTLAMADEAGALPLQEAGSKKEEEIIRSRFKDFEIMGATEQEIERLLKLRKLSEHRMQHLSCANQSPSLSVQDTADSPRCLNEVQTIIMNVINYQ